MQRISLAVSESLVEAGLLGGEVAARFRDLLLLKHRHQFEGPRKVDTGLTSVIKELLVQKLEKGMLIPQKIP